MINLFSWFIIPFLTVLMPGKSSWMKSNFSVAGNQPPGQFFLILWGSVTGAFFYRLIKKTIGQAAPFIQIKKEEFLTDTAIFLLLVSVLLPYNPKTWLLLSAIHVACAFLASVLLYLIFLTLDLKLYFCHPRDFRSLTVMLLSVLPVCLVLFLSAGAMISSALEIFFTIFCSLWLRRFYLTVLSLKQAV